MSRPQLSDLTRIPYSTLAGIENGDQEGSTRLHIIAEALRCSPTWLETGRGQEELDVAATHASPPLPRSDEYAFVARARGPRLSAGTGEVVWDFEEIDRSHAFRRDWMQRARLNPARCKLFEVRGDSMSPTLNDGDMVMINMADRDVLSGEVYALITDDGLRVKRLQRRTDGKIWMLSDNPDQRQFPAEPIESETAAVIGRIVWRGGSLVGPEEASPVKDEDVTLVVAKAFSKAGKEWGPGEPEFMHVRAEQIERARQSSRLPTVDEVLDTVRSA